jgi:hypothetical protein
VTSSGGKVVLLAEGIASTDPTNVRYGQGGGVLVFGNASSAGRSSAKASDHTTISAGNNVLSCAGCQFRTSDIGKPIWIAYAAGKGLPLWTTIAGVTGTPSNGVYPSAVLAADAEFSLPVNPPGLEGPLISIAFETMKNITISNIDLQNIGRWFHPLTSKTGIPLINFGFDGNIVKQGVTFENSTITSATNGCIANNGPLTSFTIENITCLGGTDAAIYMAGDSNTGTMQNVTVDNTGYPTATSLSNGYLMNNVNDVEVTGASVRCNCFFATFEVGDYPNFNLTLENSHLDGNNTTIVGVGANITNGLSVLNSTIENVVFAFRFDNNQKASIEGLTLTGNTILNAGSAFWSDDGSSTGYGPGNITFKNNNAQVTGNAITAIAAGGTNSFSNNTLTHEGSKGAFSWDVTAGSPTGMNSVDSNKVSGFSSKGSCSPATRCN